MGRLASRAHVTAIDGEEETRLPLCAMPYAEMQAAGEALKNRRLSARGIGVFLAPERPKG
jgi:hypothetical protein